ncbi:ABC transporter C family member 3-like [Impatiens glandulifera]|uniref:ABC transporter C family member 3-like n=1 Tax=Impatiens glandulifera TaxID=253017 RepID=UPI001FB12DFF|nr:ABC transporter C family member 3-like [Impatiens glandulifera]
MEEALLSTMKKGISLSLSYPQSLTDSATKFLLQPLFLKGLSGSLHLFLFFPLILIWLSKKLTRSHSNGETPKLKRYSSSFKLTWVFSLGLSFFYLAVCLFNYFYWYRSGWSELMTVTFIELMVRSFTWLALSVYLKNNFSNSSILLRVWLGFYVLISFYSIYADFVVQKSLTIQYFITDIVSAISGLVLCFLSFWWKNQNDENSIEEPLLNGTKSKEEEEEVIQIISPLLNANLLSVLTFSWVGSLIAVGNKKPLDLEDVPQLTTTDSVKGAFPTFKTRLESVSNSGNGMITTIMLIKALVSSISWEIILTAFLATVYTLSSYVGPYLIDSLVQYLNGRRLFKNEGYVLLSAFVIAKIIECLSQRHWFFRLQQAGIRARSVLIAKIYQKGLTLSCQSKQGHTSGEIINFMSVDAERVGNFVWYMHDPWLVVLQVSLALGILYKNLGLASVAALVATIFVMLANVPLGKLEERYQDRLMKAKDKRMKSTSEILRNMRILKLQGWEMKFLSKVKELRAEESGWLRWFLYTHAVVSFLFWGAPTFVSVVTFAACMVMGIPLESGKILSALATFRILQEPIYNLPDTISMIIQTKVSLDRVAAFLRLDDLQSDVITKIPRGSSEVVIEAVNANFSWDGSSSTSSPTLKDLNFSISRGMRVAVCGTVGSGKSSLLSCVLGEMRKISGSVSLSGTKAYVAQSPWIQSGKIEENILFGNAMNREWYDRVLDSCSLKKDMEILAFGDQTVIGERGINLSGGQKQRIQIARALYQNADIYLFDDPFSAVDAHTGSHLFKECILGMLGSKTVIYVTHQVEFLPAADLILVMKDGRITQAGKYVDILKPGTDFMELVGAHEEAMLALDSMGSGSNIVEESSSSSSKNIEKKEEEGQNGKTEDSSGQRQIVQDEEREKGKVGFSVYWKYITTAYGGILVPFILLAQIMFQTLQIGSNYWMAWATPVSEDVAPPVDGSRLILVYVVLAFGSSFCVLFRSMFLATAAFKTATIMFNKMHYSIFRAPMSFFDSTPSGRILNRASTDQSAVDLNIQYQVGAFAFSIVQLLGIIGVMSQVSWQVFILFIPGIGTCIWLQQYYIPSARELARLAGVAKAPVIQLFAETISGSTTIRSFDQETRFQEMSMELIDGSSRPKFYTAAAMEWLCFRLDMVSSLLFAFSLVFLMVIPEGTISPSVAGLAVTYGLNLNMLQAWVIWNLCSMENQIISVERILQYTTIPSEPPLVIEESKPNQQWPSEGEVEIRDLQVRYAPHMPFVLRGLTCVFYGGKRTGIVGRTGSGKSTLIQTLFRIVDPTGGKITIDGVDICSIGLHDLRLRLSIIPQEPTMFEGTVRSNLDPLEEYSDEQIWEALDKCQLGDEVRKKDKKLDSTVSENGENWSMGQRQLVCLGRVLLKKSKVLVLDEATASVDTATDNLIQKTLKEHFSDCTVLTIAHRITSVLDSDMVLVLDHGMIEEYESPTKLLENKLSSFARLVAEYSLRSNATAGSEDLTTSSII